MAEKKMTLDEVVDAGVKTILGAFDKGEDLRGAVTILVIGVANWTQQNLEEYDKKNTNR